MKQKNVFSVIIMAVVVSSLVFWGCSERSLTLQVRFPDISGLKQNDSIYFERNQIGLVKNISYTEQGDYLVKIEIIPGFKNAATEDSKFYIENDPIQPSNKALIIEQERPGGLVLKDGSIVQGSVKFGYWDEIINNLKDKAEVAETELRKNLEDLINSLNKETQNMDKELEATLEDLSSQFQKLKSEISKIPDRQEVKQLEESFKKLAEKFKIAQKDVRDFIQNELVPNFHMEMEHLREKLRKEGREKELDKISTELNEISVP